MITEKLLTHPRNDQNEPADHPATNGRRPLEIEWMDVEWTESDWLHIWLHLARASQQTQATNSPRSLQIASRGDGRLL
jgi:hypothetical protein